MIEYLRLLTRNQMLDYIDWLNVRNFSPTKENLSYFLTQDKNPAKTVEEMFQSKESARQFE